MKPYFIGNGELTGWSAKLEQDPSYADSIKKINKLPTDKIVGIEIWTEIWYSKSLLNINHAFIDTTLMEGGIGPRTSGMGSVVFIGNKESKLFAEGIGKLLPTLRKLKYSGQLSLKTTVNEDFICCENLIARTNFNTIHAFLELVDERVATLFDQLKDGTLREIKIKGELAVETKLAVPPFPYNSEGVEVELDGINRKNIRHIWLNDTTKKNGKYMYKGLNGLVGAVSARGDAVESWPIIRDAKRRVMRTIKNLKVDELMYRRDIGDAYTADISKLKQWGWV